MVYFGRSYVGASIVISNANDLRNWAMVVGVVVAVP